MMAQTSPDLEYLVYLSSKRDTNGVRVPSTSRALIGCSPTNQRALRRKLFNWLAHYVSMFRTVGNPKWACNGTPWAILYVQQHSVY